MMFWGGCVYQAAAGQAKAEGVPEGTVNEDGSFEGEYEEK